LFNVLETFKVVTSSLGSSGRITFAWDAPDFLGGAHLVEWELWYFHCRSRAKRQQLGKVLRTFICVY
jgi:hypothetical protein